MDTKHFLKYTLLAFTFTSALLSSLAWSGDVEEFIGNHDAGKPDDCGAGPNATGPAGPQSPRANPYRANPINMLSGNKFHQETVYVGPGEFPLEYTLYYNSRMRSDSGTLTGRWSASYSQHIHFNKTLFDSGKETTLELYTDNGQILSFKGTRADFQQDLGKSTLHSFDGSGRLKYKPGSVAQILSTESRPPSLSFDQPARFIYYRADGIIETYDADGRLAALRSPLGATQNITRTYTSESFDGRCPGASGVTVIDTPGFTSTSNNGGSGNGGTITGIISVNPSPIIKSQYCPLGETFVDEVVVTDNKGNQLRWTETGKDLIRDPLQQCDGCVDELVLPGESERRVTFGYQGNMLTTITSPLHNNATKTFHYEVNDGYFSDGDCLAFWACTTALTGITDETGKRYATWKYRQDAPLNGGVPMPRAYQSFHGEGDEQQDFYEITYLDGHNRKVANQFQHEQNLYFTRANGSVRLDKVTSSGGTNCKNGSLSYSYYPDGKINTIVGPGQGAQAKTTGYTYYDDGRVKSITQGEGTADERKAEYDWDTASAVIPNRISAIRLYERGQHYLTLNYSYYPNGRLKTRQETDVTHYTEPYASHGHSRTTEYRYEYWDATNRKIKTRVIDGPRLDVDDITTYEYNEQGNLNKVTDAVGNAVEYIGYTEDGLPQHIYMAGDVFSVDYTAAG